MNGLQTDVRLNAARAAWGRENFEQVLKAEIEALPMAQLPLQRCLSAGSYVMDQGFQVMVISTEADERWLRAKVGVFFASVIAGCNCADDPTPVETQPEYCELLFQIDRDGGAVTVTPEER